jgi:hypothetical protein
MLQNVPATLALLDLFDPVRRKRMLQPLFDRQFHDLALSLLGSLVGFALRFDQLRPHIRDSLVKFRPLELSPFLLLGPHGCFPLLN